MFPSSTPTFNTPAPSETLQVGGHTALHISEESNIVALATKLGIGASTPANNTVLRGNGTGTSAYDQVHLATDVSGLLPTSNYDTTGMLKLVYPIGCIYTETTGVNPGTTFGFGTWTAFGAGRVLIGNGTSDQAFIAGATGGESNHVLISNEMPSHTHIASVTDPGHNHTVLTYNAGPAGGGQPYSSNNTGSSETPSTSSNTTGVTVANSNTGGGASHNNLQPYIVVYHWQRTT